MPHTHVTTKNNPHLKRIVILLLIFIVCIIYIVAIQCLVIYLSFTFINKNFNSYQSLIHVLKSVKNNDESYFMNYGYWDESGLSLREANLRLCDIIFLRGDLKSANKILDIGCGYGEQDFYWADKTNARIEGIDIDDASIRKAQEKLRLQQNIKFECGNACMIDRKDATYDRVVSLESAFHYTTRKQFFQEAYRVLKKNGKLVMADILYNDNDTVNLLNVINRYAFGKMFAIPTANRIGLREYVKQLENIGFRVMVKDISDKTFKPYYKHFFENVQYSSKFGISPTIFSIIRWMCQVYINKICNGTNGFSYVITTCEKI